MDDISLEDVVLQNLITNDTFLRKAIPYIKEEYFADHINRCIFRALNAYFQKNNQVPNQAILAIETKEDDKISHKEIDGVLKTIGNIYQSEMVSDTEWLSQSAEKWCQDREMYLSIVKAIAIYDGTDKTLLPSAIPDMMKNALSVSFNTNIGFDWQDDSEDRYDRYELPQNKIPFDLETLNDITLGGITRKTLSLILAGVHVGKTLSLVHLTAGYARLGYQVLYISMEMDENEILHRIDANMIKTPMHLIREMGKQKFMKRMDHIKSKGYGRIKVIQFPTSAAHVGHFKNVINEFNMKMNWMPDVVMVDYIGCVASNRIKVGSTNSHFYLKSVAEEIRAMAIEYNIACWSAMQLTRSGMGSNDVEMTDIAESIGIPGVCDLMLAGMRNEETDSIGQIIFKQLKNRFRKMQYKPKFVLGCDFDQQLFYDLSQSEQNLIEDTAVSQIDSAKIQEKFQASKRRKGRFENVEV